jgi:hypothetical protein
VRVFASLTRTLQLVHREGSRATTTHHGTMNYVIEIQTEHGWFDDPSLLGPDCSESDNIWQTEDEAMQAIDALVTVGFDRQRLRVVEVDGYELSA